MALRLRRGTDAERQSITPKQGELLYVTDTGLLYVGDGTTQGGNRVSGTLQDDESPTLSANLDLNGNNIVGNGNINIDGNITATGNINIGDGVEDNVIVGGTISSDLIPTTDTAFDLGSEVFRWQNGHFTGMFVDGNIAAESITVGTVFKEDSGVLYDGLTDSIIANSFVGDLQGSVIGDDSTLLINSSASTLATTLLTLEENSILTKDNDTDIIFDSASKEYIYETLSATPDPDFQIGDTAIFAAADNYTGLTLQSNPADNEEFNLGDVTSTIIFSAENNNNKIISSTVIGTQIDPVYDETDWAQKFFVMVIPRLTDELETLDADELVRHLTFDALGRLGVNRENASATLDVNGFMLLEPQSKEPYNADDSSIPDGIVAIADGINWDPLSTGQQTMVARLDGSWVSLTNSS